MALLEKFVDPASGFLAGSALTMADVQFYTLANWLGMGALDGEPPSDSVTTCEGTWAIPCPYLDRFFCWPIPCLGRCVSALGVSSDCITSQPGLTQLVRTIDAMPAVAKWNAENNAGKVPWLPAA
jgi:hypothetical protein